MLYFGKCCFKLPRAGLEKAEITCKLLICCQLKGIVGFRALFANTSTTGPNVLYQPPCRMADDSVLCRPCTFANPTRRTKVCCARYSLSMNTSASLAIS